MELIDAVWNNDINDLEKLLQDNEIIEYYRKFCISTCLSYYDLLYISTHKYFSVDIFELVLKSLDKLNININKCYKGNSVLSNLCCYNSSSKLELLLKNQSLNVNKIYQGNSALHMAAHFGHRETIKLLLTKPFIDINLINNNNRTALMICCRRNHIDAFNLLLNDPRIDKQNILKTFKLAVDNDNIKCTRILYKYQKSQIDLTICLKKESKVYKFTRGKLFNQLIHIFPSLPNDIIRQIVFNY